MLKFKKLLLTLPAMALVVSLATTTVYAHAGHDHGDGTSSMINPVDPADGTSSSPGAAGNHGEEPKQGRDVNQKIKDEAHANEEKFRKNGKDLLLQLRSGKEARTAEQRQKSCEARKAGLQRKIDAIEASAQKHQAHFDEVFVKVSAYQKAKKLSVANFDGLVAAAVATQSKSIASVEALSSLKPSLDCTKDTAATDVATFKSAAAQARTDLSAYKKAVKDILQAVLAAKEEA